MHKDYVKFDLTNNKFSQKTELIFILKKKIISQYIVCVTPCLAYIVYVYKICV